MQIRLTLEYDGTNYSGWQVQSGQDSIQGRIEAALGRIFATPVRVRGAGRTDAGVHARGQVAAVRLPRPFASDEMRRALNAMLPPDIVVLDAAEAAADFDPRRDARLRVYEYRILNQPMPSALERRFAWVIREPLDASAMTRAAREFEGEHDFAAFRSAGSDEKTTVRHVFASQWRREGERMLVYRVEASAFLRHMVRTMVAAMVAAGRGRIAPGATGDLIRSRDRALAPPPAPACGLYLVEVRYGGALENTTCAG
ncbi:MAG TPA: tRNA pseudouridine(38-40) synthase TruA [Candidatus Binataceae bacterium]|nr:tRNA pseudouridine(38-40) synthase TruA [Candidatus Binataceae bacterium]